MEACKGTILNILRKVEINFSTFFMFMLDFYNKLDYTLVDEN